MRHSTAVAAVAVAFALSCSLASAAEEISFLPTAGKTSFKNVSNLRRPLPHTHCTSCHLWLTIAPACLVLHTALAERTY